MNIPVSQPLIDNIDIYKYVNSLLDGWGMNKYKYVDSFEKKFSKYIGKKYCLATSSCTGATHIALKAIGLEQGDEVIIPSLTWFSSSSVISYFGAKIVTAEVNKETFCIDPKSVEKLISKKTKAIICVHLYGAVCDIQELQRISKKYNLYLIEDCAESIGSKYKKKLTGFFGDISLFSFHGSKTITTLGEGGALLTNSKDIYKKALKLSNHGKNDKKIFYQDLIGFKYKMTNAQASVGISQLQKIKKINILKNRIYNIYIKQLSNLPLNFISSDKKSIPYYWMPTMVSKNKKFNKDNFLNYMKKKNINCRPVFYPIELFKCYKKFFKRKVNNPIAANLSKYGVNLPSFPQMNNKELFYVIKNIKEYFKIKNLI
jgi:perosamine synthetase